MMDWTLRLFKEGGRPFSRHLRASGAPNSGVRHRIAPCSGRRRLRRRRSSPSPSSKEGDLESELNEAGQKQAKAIAERLAKEKHPTMIYSSHLKRAKDTAEMIANKCHCLNVIEVPELKERHVGSLQGLFWSEIQEKEPEAYQAFFSSQKDLQIPGGGESFDQLCERSMSALKEIASRHKGERVIVVTHGGVLRAIYMSLTQQSAGKVLNASLNVLHLSDNKWAFKSWSYVSHLNEVGFLQRGFNGDSFQH